LFAALPASQKNQYRLTLTPEWATKEKKSSRLTRSSKILKVITKAIQDKKGEHIVSLDLRKIPEAVADFFLVCEAGSTTQVKAIADHIEESVWENCGERIYRHEGHGALHWIIIDYINVVVHVFQPETRKFYKLEEMWSDAVLAEVQEPDPQPKPPRNKKR
jgi:ribosome-associated protein